LYNLIKRALVTLEEKDTYRLVPGKKENPKTTATPPKMGEETAKGTPPTPEKAPQQDPPEVTLAREKARAIVQEASNEAKRQMAELQKAQQEFEAQMKKEKAQLEKQMAQKEAKIQEQWKQKMQSAVQALEKTSSQLVHHEEEYVQIASDLLGKLVRETLRKILFLQWQEKEEELFQAKVQSLVKKVARFKQPVFKFHPQDLEAFSDMLSNSFQKVLPDAEIRQDPNIPRGGIRIDTHFGALDADGATQMEILNKLLDEVFGGNASDLQVPSAD